MLIVPGTTAPLPRHDAVIDSPRQAERSPKTPFAE
jgi:hypothetical protein